MAEGEHGIDRSYVASLLKRIEELTAQSTKYHRMYKQKCDECQDVLAHSAELQAERDSAVVERDDFKGKLATEPGEWQKKYEESQRTLTVRDHRDAWSSVKDKLRDKVSIEKLWAEAGYEPTGNIPDAARIEEWLGKAREAAPYLFQDERSGSSSLAGQALRAGPGASRGSPETVGQVRVRSSDLADAEFMRVNQPRLLEASKAGNLVVTD